MDLESLGGAAGAGIIGAILGVFGINRRVGKIEKDKQDKTVCDALHKSADDKFNTLIKGQEKLSDKFDNLNVYLRDHRQ